MNTEEQPGLIESGEMTYESAAAIAKAAEEGTSLEMPEMETPPSDIVLLPGGYLDYTTERLIREVQIQELTGEHEELLARRTASKNMGQYLATLLKCGVVSIGDQSTTTEMIDSLALGDQHFLLLKIRQMTYGDEIHMDVVCPNCQNKMSIVYDLEKDVPIKTLENPEERVFKIDLRHGRTAQVRLPCGEDQSVVLGKEYKTVAEANTMMLSRVISDIDGEPGSIRLARALGMGDRVKILESISKEQPGPKYEEVKMPCEACGEEFPVTLSLVDMFRPTA